MYKVIRGSVKIKQGKFSQGDILPPEFTEKDRQRSVFASRIAKVEEDGSVKIDTYKKSQATSAPSKKPSKPVTNLNEVPEIKAAKPATQSVAAKAASIK